MATKVQHFSANGPGRLQSSSDPESFSLRLEDGYARIEEAIVRGVDIRAWEDFWLQLLDEYEDVCDGLRLEAA